MRAAITNDERIMALQRFGYDAEEAQFLCIAALHSGYFLRRQYLNFIRGTKGWKDVALVNKLKANQHCRVTAYRHNCMVYHLSAKPLYDSLGERDNRNRRERQPSTIKNKLMGLDFVLDRAQYNYLATEREKLEYFLGTLKFSPEKLPTRWYQSPRGRGTTAKHFVDKYPMFLAVPPRGTASVVHFCYVDEGLQSTDGFATYLSQYSRLLKALPDFRVIYIAQHHGLLGSARRVFESFEVQESGSTCAPIDPATRELLDHFEARQQYEARDFSQFDTAGLIRYREDKKRFTGQRLEEFYERWRAHGPAAVLEVLHPGQPSKEVPVGRFSTCVLEYDYDLFGTLTSGLEQGARKTQTQTQP
jgi:hypothetical protein